MSCFPMSAYGFCAAVDLDELGVHLDPPSAEPDLFGVSGYGEPIETLGLFEEAPPAPETSAPWSERCVASTRVVVQPLSAASRARGEELSEVWVSAFAPTVVLAG